jgi:profilin
MCIKTKQVMILALYDDKTQPGEASKVAEGIADYLISVGF